MGLKDPHLKTNASKRKNTSENITIDAKHNEMLKHFQNLQRSIPEKKKELKQLKEKFDEVSKLENSDFDMEIILFKDNIEEKIKILEKEIQEIVDKKEEKAYYLNVGSLLTNYYDTIEHSKKKNLQDGGDFMMTDNSHNELDEEEDDEDEEPEFDEDDFSDDESDEEEEEVKPTTSKKKKDTKPSTTQPQKSVLDFFNASNDEEKEEESVTPKEEEVKSTPTNNPSKEMTFSSMKISDFVKQESKFKKKDLLEVYLQKVDPNYIPTIKFDMKQFTCKACNYEMTLYATDGIQICEKCGIQENILIESDKPSFKDCNGESVNSSFSYKRLNHYSELIFYWCFIGIFLYF